MVDEIADLNPANTAKDPSIFAQGIHIQQNKYVLASGGWATADDRIHMQIWMFYIIGSIDIFADIDMQVSQLL
jgi:hypothetical protein